MRAVRYTLDDRAAWDDFIRKSKNGNFHLERGFIEYHGDRLTDHSLLIYDDKELVALLPGNAIDKNYYSHSGLTYGGFILLPSCRMTQFFEIVESAFDYIQQNSFEKLVYKTIPYIYHSVPADEDRHALFAAGASLIKRDVLPVIDMNNRLPYQERRARSIKKAAKNNLVVRESEDIPSFWAIVETLLSSYNSRPVHSLAEIQHLHALFPSNIRLFSAYHDDQMVAGVLIFESKMVARSQYISANETGKNFGALDLIFDHLLSEVYPAKRYFDFGTTTTGGGYELNPGLSDQKEGFGARTVVQDTYELNLTHWKQGSYREILK